MANIEYTGQEFMLAEATETYVHELTFHIWYRLKEAKFTGNPDVEHMNSLGFVSEKEFFIACPVEYLKTFKHHSFSCNCAKDGSDQQIIRDSSSEAAEKHMQK